MEKMNDKDSAGFPIPIKAMQTDFNNFSLVTYDHYILVEADPNQDKEKKE